jgi:hypothetical protein
MHPNHPRKEGAMTGSNLVPFGKYKGQPVELLAADRDYCDWLVAQPWFTQRYRDVYNIVVNYGSEPQDTPDHNALQARFLDDEFCLRVGRLVQPDRFDIEAQVQAEIEKAQQGVRADIAQAEAELAEAELKLAEATDNLMKSRQDDVSKALAVLTSLRSEDQPVRLDETSFKVEATRFQVNGWDVVVAFAGHVKILRYGRSWAEVGYYSYSFPREYKYLGELGWHYPVRQHVGHPRNLYVECKPLVGDDYPSVLRQIQTYRFEYDNARGNYVSGPKVLLLVDRFQAQGATLEQVKKIFASSGITIVMLADLESQ